VRLRNQIVIVSADIPVYSGIPAVLETILKLLSLKTKLFREGRRTCTLHFSLLLLDRGGGLLLHLRCSGTLHFCLFLLHHRGDLIVHHSLLYYYAVLNDLRLDVMNIESIPACQRREAQNLLRPRRVERTCCLYCTPPNMPILHAYKYSTPSRTCIALSPARAHLTSNRSNVGHILLAMAEA